MKKFLSLLQQSILYNYSIDWALNIQKEQEKCLEIFHSKGQIVPILLGSEGYCSTVSYATLERFHSYLTFIPPRIQDGTIVTVEVRMAIPYIENEVGDN